MADASGQPEPMPRPSAAAQAQAEAPAGLTGPGRPAQPGARRRRVTQWHGPAVAGTVGQRPATAARAARAAPQERSLRLVKLCALNKWLPARGAAGRDSDSESASALIFSLRWHGTP